jgi:hypothetical protein
VHAAAVRGRTLVNSFGAPVLLARKSTRRAKSTTTCRSPYVEAAATGPGLSPPPSTWMVATFVNRAQARCVP